jgi:hypothetical protein
MQLGIVAAAVRRAAERRGPASAEGWAPTLAVLDADYPPGNAQDTAADTPDTTTDDPLALITDIFRLSPAEQNLLRIAAAADLDPTFGIAYGELQGQPGPAAVSIGLAAELADIPLLDPGLRVATGSAGPLVRWGLLTVGVADLWWQCSLVVDRLTIGTLLGAPVSDRLSECTTVPVEPAERPWAGANLEQLNKLASALSDGLPLAFVQAATDGPELVAEAFRRAGIACVAADLERRPTGTSLVAAGIAAVRRAGLSAAGLVLAIGEDPGESAERKELIGLLGRAPVPVVLVSDGPWEPSWSDELPQLFRVGLPTVAERLLWWRKYLPPQEVPDRALPAYRMSYRQIDTVGRHLRAAAALSGNAVTADDVAAAVRALAGAGRSGTEPARTTLGDLQLPPESMSELRRLQNWLLLREEVTGRSPVHGLGGKGTGVAALFTGSPGTGKTMAAHAIADAAGLHLMQVDLSGVISKYIGETEKNLERVFATAENANVILFFDEADALFGKRSEVRDAHDRFANQEVSYLLQRIEQYNGITVLATNLRGNLDPAFSRRMHFVIHFPDPDETIRRLLWEKLLALAGPLDADDPIDLDHLAAVIELAGGDLRNIVLASTYDAAVNGGRVGSRHIVAAARREYAKMGRRIPVGLN